MLKSMTAYPITETNAHTLSHISGIELRTYLANLGWCATYAENRYPRWQIVPESVAMYDMHYPIDTLSYP